MTRSRHPRSASRGATSRRSALLALTGAFGLSLLPGCARRAPKATPVPAGATVLALGDSLTAGNGAPPEAAYPAVLAKLTGWVVANGGVSGDTAAQGLQRLPGLLAEHHPQLVLVSLGGNDLLRRLPEDALRADLRRIIDLCREAGAQVLLIAVLRPTISAAFTGSLTDHPLYGQLAEELTLPLQRQGWAEVLADERLRSDHLHANAEGYAQMAHSVKATALAVGLLTRR